MMTTVVGMDLYMRERERENYKKFDIDVANKHSISIIFAILRDQVQVVGGKRVCRQFFHCLNLDFCENIKIYNVYVYVYFCVITSHLINFIISCFHQ